MRRAAAKCLEAVIVIVTRHKMIKEFYTSSPALITRFNEREEKVKTDIFHAYQALLKQARLTKLFHTYCYPVDELATLTTRTPPPPPDSMAESEARWAANMMEVDNNSVLSIPRHTEGQSTSTPLSPSCQQVIKRIVLNSNNSSSRSD